MSATAPKPVAAILVGFLGLLLTSSQGVAEPRPSVDARLDITPTPSARASEVRNARERIDTKLTGLRERIQAWLAAGGDAHEVLPLGQKLDELLERGTLTEIEAQIDRIRAVVSTTPSPARRGAQAGLDGTPVSIDTRPIPASASIVFYSARSVLAEEVYTMNRDGGDVTQITFVGPRPDALPYEHVAVSFDRKMIVADRLLQGGSGPTGLWVIDLERRTESRLVPSFFTAGNGGVDWSPDGFIFFAGQRTVGENAGIFRIRADGSQLTQLITLDVADPGFVGDVSVSEDGSLLAYVRAVPMQGKSRTVLKTQIWVARSDGREQRMVDDGGPELGSQGGFPIGDFDPEISPDNKHVVFSRTNMQHVSFKDTFNNAQDLWVAALDGSQPARRLTQPGPISIVADWHDGKIVFTEYNEAEDFAGLALINPDGTGYRRLEPSLHKFPNCGRHGKWIPGAQSPPSR